MGYPMALNLRKKLPRTTPLFIYDVFAPVLEKFKAEAEHRDAIFVATSSKDAAQSAECIISIVPEGKHVKDVYLHPDTGVLSGHIDNKVLIDCSTIDVASSAEVSEAVKAASRTTSFYDAPVSGGTMGAEKGTITFMIGAAETDVNLPILKEALGTMGKNIFACGGPTLGLTCKLSNNYLSGLITIATSEAMNLGMRHGVDPKVLSSIFTVSTAGNWVNENCNPVPGVCPDAAPLHDYRGGFKVQLMRKDFNLAVEAAKEVDANLALGEAGLAIYTGASQDPNCIDRDARVVYRYLGGRE